MGNTSKKANFLRSSISLIFFVLQLFLTGCAIDKYKNYSASDTSGYYVENIVKEIHKNSGVNADMIENDKIIGSTRISLTIYSDGSIREIKTLTSSGNDQIDQDAINLIKKSAPFERFPHKVVVDYDVLEVIRTFVYGSSGNWYSY